MESKNKTIEVCVGIGLDQITPQYITIEIPSKEENLFPEKLEKANKDLKDTKDILPKKRGRKPKKDDGGQTK
jgi:hypothetical protein